MNYGILAGLLMGLGGSFHCLGMCGPLVLMMHGQKHQRNVVNVALHHLGRIVAYWLLMILFFNIGNSAHWMGWQNGVALFGGIIFIMGWIPFFQKKISKWLSPIRNQMSGILPQHGEVKHFLLGLMNGWLPCGWSISAIGAALLTQNLWSATGFIFLFGLGSSPALIAVVWGGDKIQRQWPWIQSKWTRIALVSLGLLLILRGANLGIPYVSPKIKAEKMSCCQR
jgi:sulfite exporter TauE/SafE